MQAHPCKSPADIENYLVKFYVVNSDEAKLLLIKYDALIKDAIFMRSFIYYTGDKIADAEELQERDSSYADDNDQDDSNDRDSAYDNDHDHNDY